MPFDNTVAGAGYTNEAKWTNFLSKLKTAKAAGQVNVLTQQGFYASRERMAKPRNYVFNPASKFRRGSGCAGVYRRWLESPRLATEHAKHQRHDH